MTLEQIVGAGLMLLFLTDIFLTVLYARAGTGLLAPRWNRLVWSLIKAVSRLFGRHRSRALAFGGPMMVVTLIAFWALGLTIGAAFIIRPELGVAIRPSSGTTPTDFVTALLVAGNSLSIVGSGDYSPNTSATRIFFLFDSLIGASVLSLVLSYLVQVYSALRERNALALLVDLMTGGTGDAAEMLARLGPEGDFSNATSEVGSLAQLLVASKEAHHFYPLLFYFRFREPLYSVSRVSFILLDLTTLIETTLNPQKHGTFTRSAAAKSVHECAKLLLGTLDRHFPTEDKGLSSPAHVEHHKRSYAAALMVLHGAGIETLPDVEAYSSERSQWEPLVRRIGPTLGYEIEEFEGHSRTRPAAF